MTMVCKVASPPLKPLMIYDGDCGFCKRWIGRWKSKTGDCADYVPFQDHAISKAFPEIAPNQFEAAVHLITPDGLVYIGAEAVFRSLAFASRGRWLLNRYQRSKTFARWAEWCYRFVARHRRFFSALS